MQNARKRKNQCSMASFFLYTDGMAVKEKWRSRKPLSMSTDAALAKILPLLQARPQIRIAWLFGSRAQDRERPGSDLDIAIETGPGFDWEDLYRLSGDASLALDSDRVDVVWLKQADALLAFSVVSEGKTLFYRDAEHYNEWERRALHRYREYCIYLKKHRGYVTHGVHSETVAKRVEKLRQYYMELEAIGPLKESEYGNDKIVKYAVERLLFLICENIMDCLDHLLSTRHAIVSDTYEQVLVNAEQTGILDKALFIRVQGLGGFRNVLAHEYLAINDSEVFRNLQKLLDLRADLLAALERQIT